MNYKISDIYYNDFAGIYRECTGELHSFLTTDATLSVGDPLRFSKNLLTPL